MRTVIVELPAKDVRDGDVIEDPEGNVRVVAIRARTREQPNVYVRIQQGSGDYIWRVFPAYQKLTVQRTVET